MSIVIPFRPRHEFDAEKNLREFIEHCRVKLDLYGADLDWNAERWDVSARHRRRGRNDKKVEMVFSSLGSTKHKMIPMHDGYSDFAKAYMRHAITFSGDKVFANTLAAVRVLEKALVATSRDSVPMRVHLTDQRVADNAVEVIEEHYQSPSTRYQSGWHLQNLIEFLGKANILATPFSWKNPFTPPEMATLVGEEYDNRRAAKMPSREVLSAVGTIFDSATEMRDVIISSCIALLCSASGRISEAVTLQNHCEVWLDDGPGEKDLALRWHPAKDGTKGLKHVLKAMEPVALLAISKTRALTEQARRLALWYEENPGQMFLPVGLEHLRSKELLSGEELSLVFGFKNPADAPKMAGVYGLTVHRSSEMLPNRLRKDGSRSESLTKINRYLFAEVEQKILSYLPPGFPWMDKENGVKYSEALFVVSKGAFNPTQGTMPCMFMGLNSSAVMHQFTGQAKSTNIFMRRGFKNPDGSTMRMQTHQVRHWLNTIAESSGLSDLERDMWSGRVTSAKRGGVPGPPGRQSLAYLHNTTEDLMAAAGLQAEDMDRGTSLAAVVDELPVSREEFLALEDKPTVHVTEYGVCFHDFALQPCQVHADCLNCMEHACIKGGTEKSDRIRQCHAIAVEQIGMAKKMVEEKYLRAEPWYLHQALTEKRLAALLELLDDESVPADAIIMLVNPFQYSAFRNAILDRAANLGDAQSICLADDFTIPLLPLIEGLTPEVTNAPTL